MAKKVESDEERDRRVLLVGEYVMNTGSSTRKTASFFTKTYFSISNATVSDYCGRYLKMRPKDVDILRGKIDANMVLDAKNPLVRKRILDNTKLFLTGLTVNEVAQKRNLSFWTFYRDLNTRLKMIDYNLYLEVQDLLTLDSKRNLRNVK